MDCPIRLPQISTLPVLLVLLLLSSILVSPADAQTSPNGPYLGQTPPGKTPAVFGQGFISSDAHEFSFSTNPEATEIYFSRGTGENNIKQIMVTRLVDGIWTDPAPLFPDFADEHFEPCVAPDGRHLYFMAFHAVEGQARPDCDMFRSDRAGAGWGTPYRLDAPFNPSGSMFASVSRDGAVYTTDPKSGGTDIARARPAGAGFAAYENLGAPINTPGPEMYPFVAPDESFLLFNRMAAGRRPLMVSFKLQSGDWSEPQEIPLGMEGGSPFVSRDGKYLFFTAGKRPADIYWVDFNIVRSLMPASSR